MENFTAKWEDRFCKIYHKSFRVHTSVSYHSLLFQGCFSAAPSQATVTFSPQSGLKRPQRDSVNHRERLEYLNCISHTVSELHLSPMCHLRITSKIFLGKHCSTSPLCRFPDTDSCIFYVQKKG